RLVATGGASKASATRGRLRQLRTAPEGRRRRPARLAPPMRLALRAFPPPLRGGHCSCGHFHGLRSPSGFAPPVATTRRPSGATQVACQRRKHASERLTRAERRRRRGEGMLPRVKRAQRAHPVESVADIETAPEGRRLVATGGASAASATRGRLRQLRTAPEGRRRRPTRLAPPLRFALRAFPP